MGVCLYLRPTGPLDWSASLQLSHGKLRKSGQKLRTRREATGAGARTNKTCNKYTDKRPG